MASELTTSEEYIYQPLESRTTIRLLKILPDRVNGDIACTIEHITEDKLPCTPYSALSYYWGKTEQNQHIYIGNAHGDTMHKKGIHQNLWEFLDQMFQMKHNEEFLWTDFLCLDQKSKDYEIPQQVPRMGEIYSEATRTISWLGRPTSSTTITSLQDVKDTKSPIGWILNEWLPRTQGTIDSLGLSSRSWTDLKNGLIRDGSGEALRPKFTKLAGNALPIHMKNILALPYWQRIWIIQEVALARQVDLMYGKETIGFEEFFLAYKCYFYYQMFHSQNTEEALSETKPAVEARDSVAGGSLPIWEILEWESRCQSSKQADRLYGLLGFLKFGADSAHHVGEVKVDYNKDLSDIYWEFALEWRLSRSSPSRSMTNTSLRDLGRNPSSPERKLYLRYRYECGWIPDYGHKLVLCWIFLSSLRKALMCAGTFDTLGKLAKGAKVPPRQRNMALVAERLISARRAVGSLRESNFTLIGSEPKSWSNIKGSSLAHILLWVFLEFDKSNMLPEPDDKVQAAAIGTLVELEQQEEHIYGLARWECRARQNVSSWPGIAQSVIRFKSSGEEMAQCCLHDFEQSNPTQQECKGLPLFLDLPEIGSVLKFDIEVVKGDPDAKFAVVSIAADNAMGHS